MTGGRPGVEPSTGEPSPAAGEPLVPGAMTISEPMMFSTNIADWGSVGSSSAVSAKATLAAAPGAIPGTDSDANPLPSSPPSLTPILDGAIDPSSLPAVPKTAGGVHRAEPTRRAGLVSLSPAAVESDRKSVV